MDKLTAFLKQFNGYKTYFLCLLALVILVLGNYAIISPESVTKLLELLGVFGVATLRHGMKVPDEVK